MRLLEPSEPAGVIQEIKLGETETTAQLFPPIVTVVDPADSQKPLPVMLIVWPPHTDPKLGETELIAILLVRRPIFDTALPCPSTFTITSYSPAGKAGGKKEIDVEEIDVTSAWNVPSVRSAISINSVASADLFTLLPLTLTTSKREFSISLHFNASTIQIAISTSSSS